MSEEVEMIIAAINDCLTMDDLDELRMPIVTGMKFRNGENNKKVQKAFIDRKNKIIRHGGKING